MLNCARQSLRRTGKTIWVLTACLAVAACGVSSPATQLPTIDHTRPVTLLNAKQKSKALEELGKMAQQQNEKAAALTPITYKIPDSPP